MCVLHSGVLSSSQDGVGEGLGRQGREVATWVSVCAHAWSKCQDMGMSTVCAHKCVKANDWERT